MTNRIIKELKLIAACFKPLWERPEKPPMPIDFSDERYSVAAKSKDGSTTYYQCLYARGNQAYVVLMHTRAEGVSMRSHLYSADDEFTFFHSLKSVGEFFCSLEGKPEFTSVTIPDFWRDTSAAQEVFTPDGNVHVYTRKPHL